MRYVCRLRCVNELWSASIYSHRLRSSPILWHIPPLLSFQMLGLTKGPLGTTAKFLNKAMDPPHPLAVQNAIELLVDIGAFDQGVCAYVMQLSWQWGG